VCDDGGRKGGARSEGEEGSTLVRKKGIVKKGSRMEDEISVSGVKSREKRRGKPHGEGGGGLLNLDSGNLIAKLNPRARIMRRRTRKTASRTSTAGTRQQIEEKNWSALKNLKFAAGRGQKRRNKGKSHHNGIIKTKVGYGTYQKKRGGRKITNVSRNQISIRRMA